MPRSYGRNERVAAAILREIADVLHNELKDPRVKNATVTEVKVTSDLRNARIYISFLTDSQEEIDKAMEGLNSSKGYIRSTLAGRLNLRYMPSLDFKFDSLVTESMKLDELIRKGLSRE